jgi:hyaluronan synthase
MKDVRKSYPDLIIVDMKENRGKRPALEAGTRISTGEILVFVDSDSLVEPGAIKCLVDAFVDPKIAGVCGHCDVANQWTNLLTKMQSVRYYIGFRVIKAAESIFDAVTCLSGPLAAYRRDVLMTVMDDWVHQTILGRPATYGDDRSLTNFILKLRYKVIYDSRARCRTIVPQNYRQFFKQQMRWKRSWFRESLRLSAYVWRLQPLMSISFYLGFILPLLGPFIVLRSIVWVPLYHNGSPLTYILGVFLMSSLMSAVYLFVKRSRLWVYGIVFCFFYMFVIIWQMPLAMATFTKTKLPCSSFFSEGW